MPSSFHVVCSGEPGESPGTVTSSVSFCQSRFLCHSQTSIHSSRTFSQASPPSSGCKLVQSRHNICANACFSMLQRAWARICGFIICDATSSLKHTKFTTHSHSSHTTPHSTDKLSRLSASPHLPPRPSPAAALSCDLHTTYRMY